MSSWMELYPTISSDIRFTNMLGQPGKILFFPNLVLIVVGMGQSGRWVVLENEGRGGTLFCFIKKNNNCSSLVRASF